jgi:hypothetical protein
VFRFVVGVVVGILLALAVLLSVGTVLRGGLQHADVIVALSGDTTGARAAAAASLYRAGFAPAIIFSNARFARSASSPSRT